MKRLKSKRKLLVLAVAAFLFTSLIVSCSNSSGGGSSGGSSSGDDDKPTQPSGNGNGNGGSGNGGNGGNGGSNEPTTLASIKDPITLTFNIRAKTQYCDVYRKKVDVSGNDLPGEGWIILGSLYPDSEPDYDIDRTKKFTDLFGVKKDCYYKYATFSELTNVADSGHWDEKNTVYKATYDGLRAPELGTGDKYPVIVFAPAENTEPTKLHLANKDDVDFTFYNQEEITYWALTPVYNWTMYTWFDPDNDDWGFEDNGINISQAATGDNPLTKFYFTLWLKDDTNNDFCRRFYCDVKDINEKKITKKFTLKDPEILENNTEKKVIVKLRLPEDDIRDIYIQRRVHSEDTWEKTSGYLDNRDTDYSVGYINADDIKPSDRDSGYLTFTDRYNFKETEERYDYRAIVRLGDNYEEMEIPLGTTTVAKVLGGAPEVKLQYGRLTNKWENQALKIYSDQTNILVYPSSNPSQPESAIYPMMLMLTYVKEGDETKVFNPVFKYENDCWNIDAISVPDNLGDNYTLKLVACNVVFQTQTGINQMLKINTTNFGDANIRKTLVYPPRN